MCAKTLEDIPNLRKKKLSHFSTTGKKVNKIKMENISAAIETEENKKKILNFSSSFIVIVVVIVVVVVIIVIIIHSLLVTLT